VIDWSILDGPAAASRFADLIVEAPRSFLNSTSIGSAIDFATAQIAKAPFEAERHAIDVSGDGTNNAGRDVRFFRDRAVANDIVVNGIVILTDIQFAQNPAHTNPPGGIEKYYRDNVIGGPGSFVVVAEDYNSFGRAMVKKLIAEIAIDPAQRPAQHRSTEVNAIGWTQERESLPTDWRRRDDIGPDGERGSCPRRVDDPRRGRRRTGLAQRRIRRIEPFFLKTTPS